MSKISLIEGYLKELENFNTPIFIIGDIEAGETISDGRTTPRLSGTFFGEAYDKEDSDKILKKIKENPSGWLNGLNLEVYPYREWYVKSLEYLNSLIKPKRLKGRFKLTGLGRKKSITCEPLDNQNTFWCEVGLTQDRFDAFWNYYAGRYPDEKFFVEIEYEKLADDGVPINGKIVSIIIE